MIWWVRQAVPPVPDPDESSHQNIVPAFEIQITSSWFNCSTSPQNSDLNLRCGDNSFDFVRGNTVPSRIDGFDDVVVGLAGGHVRVRIGGCGHGRCVERGCALATGTGSSIDVVGHSSCCAGRPLQQN